MAQIRREKDVSTPGYSTAATGKSADRATRRWTYASVLASGLALQFAVSGCGDAGPSLRAETAGGAPVEIAPGDTSEPGSTPKVSSEIDGVAPGTVNPAGPTEPTQDQPPSADAAPSPAPSTAPFVNLRILALGDSMTGGAEANPSGFRSYRGALYRLLVDAGHSVDFVGPLWQPPAIGGDPDHAGYGGAQIGPGGASNNISDRLDSILASAGNVDVVILAMGWNSAYQEPENAAPKYAGLVQKIRAARPNATLVLATLSPQRGETEAQTGSQLTGYSRLNATARQLANASDSDKLILADLASAGFEGNEYWDVIHWLQPGADRAARVIFDTLIHNVAIIRAK